MGLPEKKYISAEEYLAAESVSIEKQECMDNVTLLAKQC
jgi:hypothetical protein